MLAPGTGDDMNNHSLVRGSEKDLTCNCVQQRTSSPIQVTSFRALQIYIRLWLYVSYLLSRAELVRFTFARFISAFRTSHGTVRSPVRFVIIDEEPYLQSISNHLSNLFRVCWENDYLSKYSEIIHFITRWNKHHAPFSFFFSFSCYAPILSLERISIKETRPTFFLEDTRLRINTFYKNWIKRINLRYLIIEHCPCLQRQAWFVFTVGKEMRKIMSYYSEYVRNVYEYVRCVLLS